ncbi:DNA repair helicase RadD [Vibrio chagasii]|nr:Putative DNA repair helicase [Vibrio chagasii]CAH6894001.1 DNA repair helicase RadD [Vibrio chagasii]CAH6968034.1 DNA repair helicase RadD [Vibrio chagasii]CAH7121956.1 DNA repair helicase RadD [Vibrio chagasii]CAH7152289.1 DNA repair helicase RadD [Vibrio chagasii]
MLLDLLSRCSSLWLSEQLSTSALTISESYLSRELKKSELTAAVATKYSIDFVSKRDLREELIKRLKPEEARILVNQLTDIDIPESDLWDFLNLYIANQIDALTIFARYLGLEAEYLSSLESYEQTKDVILASPNYGLYPYQRKISRTVLAAIEDKNEDRLLIHLPTGAGKTRTAMSIACGHLNSNEQGLVVWLADTEELCAQASQEFAKAWSSLGNRETSIYSYFSDSEKTLTGVKEGIIVAGLQRLNVRKDGKEESAFAQLLEHATLVIFDEAHKAIAQTYKDTVNRFMSKGCRTFLVGLSATPGRKFDDEDEDQKLAEFFNEQKVTMEISGYSSPVQYLIDQKYLAEPDYLPIDYDGSKELEFTEKEVKEELSKLLKNLSGHESRNSAIIKQAITEYENDSSIIIFACNVEHAVALAETLHCLGYPAASLTSAEDSKESRRYKIEAFKQKKIRILINFGILTTGFDAPCTNVAIIARPTLSLVLYSQMAGRAMRGKRSGGNEKCKVYTVLDNIPEFTSLSKAFGHWNNNWNEIR